MKVRKLISLAVMFMILMNMVTVSAFPGFNPDPPEPPATSAPTAPTSSPTFAPPTMPPITPPVQPSRSFTITNPYAAVNWATFSQFKAGLHTHTNQSDGHHTVTEMANRYYTLGYHIMSINEHNVVSPSPDRTLTGAGEHNDNRGRARVPLPLDRIARMESGQATRTTGGGHGMIFIPYTNEPSNLSFSAVDRVSGVDEGHHINTYWTETNREYQEEISSLLNRMQTLGDGIGVINHAGRNTGALRDNVSENEARRISNNSSIYRAYADMFMNHHNLVGLEIVNKLDPETRADRLLWDNILKTTMPQGRPVWGSATDDAHHQRDVGFAYNLMLMPELSLSEFRRSFESGAFFAFSRVSQDPNYRIVPGAIEEWYWLGREVSSSNVEAVHTRPVPQISRIDVDESRGTISITATGFDSIRWYADGVEIARGASLDLNAHANSITSYVRATVVSNANGVLYVQPFGVQTGTPRALPTLVSANTQLAPIVLPQGSLKTQMGLRLPGGVQLTERAGTTTRIRPAAIMWQDLTNIVYNSASPKCQTFTVRGDVFIDPNRVSVPAGVSRPSVSVQVSVPCMPNGCECSLCNDCGECRFCDPCLRCTGKCRQVCDHRNCDKIFTCGTCDFCTRSPVSHDYRWTGADGESAGNFNFFREFPIDLPERFTDLRSVDTELRIAFSSGSPSPRRILVWTDLTGTPDTALVRNSNINAGRIVRSESAVAQGDTSVRLTIPRAMLYDSGSGQFATVIYVLSTTNSTNFDEQPTGPSPSGIYRTDLTDLISNITLSVTGLPQYGITRHITQARCPTCGVDKLWRTTRQNGNVVRRAAKLNSDGDFADVCRR